MQGGELAGLLIVVGLVGAGFLAFVLFLMYTQAARSEAAKAARTDQVQRVKGGEIMDVLDLHDNRVEELTEEQRWALQRYQDAQRASEQARRDQAAQEALYRRPSNSVFFDPQRT